MKIAIDIGGVLNKTDNRNISDIINVPDALESLYKLVLKHTLYIVSKISCTKCHIIR